MHLNYLSLVAALLLTACSDRAADDETQASGSWDTFVSAMSDELRGDPSAKALERLRPFHQAGIAFDHPDVLRVRVDRESYPSWKLTRGDFELEVHAADAEFAAEDYLVGLANAMASDKSPAGVPKPGAPVHWCGIDIQPIVVPVIFFGDQHELRGYDLPAGESGPRFLIFDDMLIDGRWSATAQATFDALSASIRCDGNAPALQ